MTCRELTEFIADYLSGDLTADSRASFEQHLSVCQNCRRYLAAYRETVLLGKQAFDDIDATIPADVPDELVRAILDAKRR